MTSSTGDVLAVVSQRGCTVGFYDVADYRLLSVLDVAPQPHEMCFDPVRRLLYVSHTYVSGWYFDNEGRARAISVIDADRRKLADVVDLAPDHGPHGIGLDPAGERLYVTVEAAEGSSGALLVLDAETRTVLDRIPVEASGPHWFACTPDGGKVYTTNKESAFVSVVDVRTRRMTGRVDIPGSEDIAVSLDGGRAFVAGPAYVPGSVDAEPGLRVIDTATDEVVGIVPTARQPSAVHVTSAGDLLVGQMGEAGEVISGDGGLLVYPAGALEPAGCVPVGGGPLTVTSSPDGKLAFVANVSSGTVSVVDIAGLRAIRTLDGIPGAHGLAYLPAR
jgi:YVTN family beta-propeller protein